MKMKKIKMTVELEYDDEIMHGDCKESEEWFRCEILNKDKGLLLLHSNEIGDSVGKITILGLVT